MTAVTTKGGVFCRACSPAPAEATSTSPSTSKACIPWDGGAVWVVRTRREPVHGGSMAPSMAPTVLPTHTAPPLTVGRRLLANAAVGGCRPLVGTSVRQRMNSSTHSVALLRQAVGWCRPWSTRFFHQISNEFIRAAQRSAPTRAECRSDRSRKTVEGGVGPVEGGERHGPEACLGRVGQDAPPRSCRVRRTAHTSKPRPSLHGRTCSVPLNRTQPA